MTVTLPTLLAEWDTFAARIRQRIEMGHGQYGVLYEQRGVSGNCAEAELEEADAVAYMFFAYLLAKKRGKR